MRSDRSDEPFIFGDWGSTAMRLALCRIVNGELEEIDTLHSAGIKFVADPEAAFFSAAQSWLNEYGPRPVILAGMVGSNRGWKEAPYVECPAAANELAGAALRFEARGVAFTILPGLGCTNIFGLPDVMRGEEAQIFGLNEIAPAAGRQLVCLPGTHAKWAVVEDGVVSHFFTSMQGELFDMLLKHSLLGTAQTRSGETPPVSPEDPAFRQGLGLIVGAPSLSIEHAIFAARALLVKGVLAENDVPAYLSGILTGADMRDALHSLEQHGDSFDTIDLVGSPALVRLYAAAAKICGRKARCHDAGPVMQAAAKCLAPTVLQLPSSRNPR